MAQLYWKVRVYLEANSKTASEFDSNIKLVNDGAGDYIHTWNVSGLAKPSDSQLDTADTQATKDENNHVIRKTRKKLYGTTAEQLEYIVENGLEAFIAKQNQIKSENPKS